MNRRLAGIALVVGLAAVLALSVVLLVVKNKDKDIAPGANDSKPPIAQQTDDTVTEPSADNAIVEDERRAIVNLFPELETGESEGVLAYRNTAEHPQLLKIQLKSDDSVVFYENVIPGDTIEKFKLLNDLGAGEYPCTVYVFDIDESTGEPFPDQVPLGIEMNITIKA